MKKIIILLLTLFIVFSCTQPTGEVQTVYVDNPSDNPIIDPDALPIKLALYDGTRLAFYDGSAISTEIVTSNAENARERAFSIDNVLYYYDEFGAVESSYNLPCVPEEILAIESSYSSAVRAVIYQDEIWTLDSINKEEANALGGGYNAYTHIFKYGEEVAPWYTYQFEVESVHHYPATNQIIVIDTAGALHNITDSETPYYFHGDLIVFNVDFTNRTADIVTPEGMQSVDFDENYFYTSRWQICGDTWLSQHGLSYSYTEGLTEHATSLDDFISMVWPNNAKYSLWPAGQREENSEMVSYWLDSTSGFLYRYVPSTDQYSQVVRLYIGPMSYADGNIIAKSVDPQWIDGDLYYHIDGSIKVYDPEMGSIEVFAVDQEIWGW